MILIKQCIYILNKIDIYLSNKYLYFKSEYRDFTKVVKYTQVEELIYKKDNKLVIVFKNKINNRPLIINFKKFNDLLVFKSFISNKE